jgi:hypothetical protein
VDSVETWALFSLAYALTVLIETPLLFLGLSRHHPCAVRLFAGPWLTACTYPVVWFILPAFFDMSTERILFLAVAETFAPAAECLLFSLAVDWQRTTWRDWAVIVLANLTSFGLGELLWWGLGMA